MVGPMLSTTGRAPNAMGAASLAPSVSPAGTVCGAAVRGPCLQGWSLQGRYMYRVGISAGFGWYLLAGRDSP